MHDTTTNEREQAIATRNRIGRIYGFTGRYGATPLRSQDWPWCDACQSWHHPNNPTCRKITAE